MTEELEQSLFAFIVYSWFKMPKENREKYSPQADGLFAGTKGRDEHCSGVRHVAGPSHLLSRALGTCRALPAILVVFAALALASSLALCAEASAVIHDVQDVLANYTRQLNGRLYFTSPSGQTWELITDIDDPEIVNKGDGSFHPLAKHAVEEALFQITYSLDMIPLDVFILPYPRRGLLESSASPGKIVLSPGVREYLPEQIHFTVTHELGHIVHRHFMPDDNSHLWQKYRELRHITDTSIYNNNAIHRDRPTEIFAEDFRFLFGSELANYSGSIENGALPLSTRVEGLREFFLSLPYEAHRAISLRLTSFPNPFNPVLNINFSVAPFSEVLTQRGALDVSGPGGTVATQSSEMSQVREPLVLRVFDVNGRLVQTLIDDQLPAGSYYAVWTGTDEQGRRVTSGIYFLRLETGEQAVTKKVILSR